jgi:hypothetical protein
LIAVACSSVAPAAINVGVLPSDGTPVRFNGSLAIGQADYFLFTLSQDITNVPGTYLSLQTYGVEGMNYGDTEIALFDSSMNLIARDDDDNSTFNTEGDHYDLYSLLSFGPSDPYFNDGNNNPYGASLPAGTYTLVVTSYGADFADGSVTPGDETADYLVQFRAVLPSEVPMVPAPSAALLAVSGLIGLVRLREK